VFLVKFDLKFGNNTKNKVDRHGKFSLTKTYFLNNIQKTKYFNFFRIKFITQNEFCSYSVPLFILAYPIREKT
jgi:hypothetical protein